MKATLINIACTLITLGCFAAIGVMFAWRG